MTPRSLEATRSVRSGRSVFGRELAMLAQGVELWRVLQSFLGTCSQGRAALGIWLQVLARVPTLHQRRKLLEHFLRTFEGARRHGSQWRVVDAKGFVGHQHEWVPELVQSFDMETGEVTTTATGKVVRSYVRARGGSGRAGGLAPHDRRCPRTLHRYRGHLRAAGIMGSQQPSDKAKDAVFPKRPRRPDGRWAYGQHWLKLPPTAEMVARWRATGRKPVHAPVRAPQRPFSALRPPSMTEILDLSELVERDD